MKDTTSDRYRRLSAALIQTYGEKVYKIPLSIAGTCPNRDGTLSTQGCTMCATSGIDFELLDASVPLALQLEHNVAYISGKYKAHKFIAYFQNYTTTYLRAEQVVTLLEQVNQAHFVEIALSARPDCLSDELLEALEAFQRCSGKLIVLELGVQILNDAVLSAMNRGHDAQCSIDAIARIKEHALSVCAHVMLNYPGVEDADIIHTAKVLSALKVDRVKCHSLYIQEHTHLSADYKAGRLTIGEADDYMHRVILFLRYLSPEVVVERLFARAPKKDTLFCNWGRSWRFLQNELERKLESSDIYQGDLL